MVRGRVGAALASRSMVTVLAEWQQRVDADPLLQQYPRTPAPEGEGLPDGFHLSEDLTYLRRHGGFWPGGLRPLERAVVREVIDPLGRAGAGSASILWTEFGCLVPSSVVTSSPATRERVESAPVFVHLAQEDRVAYEFPTEASLLEAALITYDELGCSYQSGRQLILDPYFVEWLGGINAPDSHPEGWSRVRPRLLEAAQDWPTGHHPCWPAGLTRWMGLVDRAPAETVRATLGKR